MDADTGYHVLSMVHLHPQSTTLKIRPASHRRIAVTESLLQRVAQNIDALIEKSRAIFAPGIGAVDYQCMSQVVRRLPNVFT
jgi:hypothetical protein